jgi:hypothetical protein
LADIRLIDPPRAIGGFQFSSASLVQFWSVALYPAPNGGVVGWQTRSTSNSSTSRYESENRRDQRTAQTMISGWKWRHLNRVGRGWGNG